MTTYAVTAATGHLGTASVEALLDRGVAPTDLVAVVRDPAKADHLSSLGVQVRRGDYDDDASLRSALAGVDRVLLVSSPTVGSRTAQHRNVVEAAEAAGVQRLAYTSLAKADTNSMPLGEEHRATESLLADSPLETVVLRNGWYLENYTDNLDQYRATGAVVGAAGGARVSAAPRAEYAAAAAAVLTADAVERPVHELGGPAFTMPELAAALSRATGTEIVYRDLTPEQFEAGLREAGLDAGTAAFVTALERGTAAGDLEVPTTDLDALLGRPAAGLDEALAGILA